mgnify:CR=1 FL=1
MLAGEDQSFGESLAEFGARKTYAATSHEEAVERARAAFINHRLGNPIGFSPLESIRQRTEKEPPSTWGISIGVPRAGKIIAEEARDDAATLAPCHVVQRASEGTQRVYHTGPPKMPGEAGLASEDSTPADD